MILAVFAVAIYGLGRLITSNVTSVVGVDYHAGKIQASNNSSFSHSHSSSDNSIFQARRIAISRVDDHPVLDQVVTRLRDDLLALGFVNQVDVFGPDETQEPGGLLYDAYLTLSIDVQQDEKPFVERDFKATVHIAVGTMPFNSRSTYHDHLSTPGINYALNGQLDHTSQSTQVGTPYKMIADNIGEELAGKLAEQFTAWHEQFGANVDWPDDLIGTYPDDLWIPWPPGIDQKVLVDGYGLMQHRHALWSVLTGNPESFVQKFHKAYVDAGWRIEEGAVITADEHHSRYHFRAWDGSPHQVEVFEVRDGFGQREPGDVSRICVRYQHRFDRPETRAVIARLLDNDINLPVLRVLQSQMTREQKAHYFQILADSNPTDPRDSLVLAEYHHRQGQADEAKRYLRRASLFAFRAHDTPSLRKKITESAKEKGFDEQVFDPPITPELMAEVGYQSLKVLAGSKSTIGLNQAVQLYYPAEDRLHMLDLWFDVHPDNSKSIMLNHHERKDRGSTSWGNQSVTKSMDRVYCTWEIDSDTGRFTVHMLQQEANPELFDVEIIADQINVESNS